MTFELHALTSSSSHIATPVARCWYSGAAVAAAAAAAAAAASVRMQAISRSKDAG